MTQPKQLLNLQDLLVQQVLSALTTADRLGVTAVAIHLDAALAALTGEGMPPPGYSELD